MTDETTKFMTRSDYATYVGVSVGTICRLVKDGRINLEYVKVNGREKRLINTDKFPRDTFNDLRIRKNAKAGRQD